MDTLTGKQKRGKLVRWQDDKGFGFIKPESGGADVFIHISELKHMSRPPKVGDFIYFVISRQSDGKSKAVQARIEGVKRKQLYKRSAPKQDSSWLSALVGITVVFGIGYYAFTEFQAAQKRRTLANTPVVKQIPATSKARSGFSSLETSRFQCDGRQHCSQMRSRAEAVFFINHCPGTKMDGDNDGIPCESDSRF